MRLKVLGPGVTLGAALILLVLARAAPQLLLQPQAPPQTPGAAPVIRPPERPRGPVDTTYPVSAGRTIVVPSGGDLQEALNRARPGDVITLQAGAIFQGPFTLPQKPGREWIIVRTSAADADLPPPGRRIDPSFAPHLPKLEAASGSVLRTAPGAHHYRLVGLEIRPRPGTFLHNVVFLGGEERAAARLPHHIIIDRCYVHGDPTLGSRRGIALNSQSTAVVDSYLADFKEVGADSQAIAGWNGPGPFKIINNHLEGAGENLIFGGSAPSLRHLVPSDIEIRGNHLYKPLSWKIGDPAYAGTPWTVKNLFELKNARRVLVEQNLLENNWVHAQNGFAVLLTVRTERDAAPWSVVEDVNFSANVVRRVAAGVNLLGIDDSSPAGLGRTRNVAFTHNLFVEVGGQDLGGSGTLFQILNGVAGLRIDHNTAFHAGSIISADMAPSTGLEFLNNIVQHNEYGVFGSGWGSGLPALDHYFAGYVFRRNVVVGTPGALRYPEDNFHPPTLGEVGFADLAAGDYRLGGDSPYRGAATDGSDVGADMGRLAPALANGAGGPGG